MVMNTMNESHQCFFTKKLRSEAVTLVEPLLEQAKEMEDSDLQHLVQIVCLEMLSSVEDFIETFGPRAFQVSTAAA